MVTPWSAEFALANNRSFILFPLCPSPIIHAYARHLCISEPRANLVQPFSVNILIKYCYYNV